jgi:hypothetical protein
MFRQSINERTPIFFNSILSRNKLNKNNFKVINIFNSKYEDNYGNREKNDKNTYKKTLFTFKNLQRIK